jgi:hypothetical protein
LPEPRDPLLKVVFGLVYFSDNIHKKRVKIDKVSLLQFKEPLNDSMR